MWEDLEGNYFEEDYDKLHMLYEKMGITESIFNEYLENQAKLEQEREEKAVSNQNDQNNLNNQNRQDNQNLEIVVMDVKNQDEVNKEIYNLLHGKVQTEKDYDVKGKAREIIKSKEAPMMPKLMAHLLIKSFEEEYGKDEKQFENDKED